MIDANEYYLNQHLAELDAADSLDEWRANQAAEIQHDILEGGNYCDPYDIQDEKGDELQAAITTDLSDDCYLIQLIIAAHNSGDEKMVGLAKPFMAVIESAAAAIADRAAENMDPEVDDEE